MKRRELVLGLIGALLIPFDARSQQRKMPVIGFLSSKGKTAEATALKPMIEALARQGFAEGSSVSIVYRFCEGRYDRLPAQAADLVARKVDVIVASGLPATLAAKDATATIPIVFRLAIDPVAFHLVQDLNRPDGNVTGVTTLFDPLTPKKLQLLHELVPAARLVGFLINSKNPNASSHVERAQAAAKSLGFALTVLRASTRAELTAAFVAAHRQGIAAILVGDDPFFDVAKADLLAAEAETKIPVMFYVRDFVEGGGLISYGPSFEEMARHAGLYVARILKGEKPAALPVQQPTAFELVVNLKTAKALGLTIPSSILLQADRVIE